MTPTGLKIYDGFEVRAQEALDPRTIVTNREDLYNINSWPHDEITGIDPENVPENILPVTYLNEDGSTTIRYYVVYMKEGMRVTVTGPKDNRVFDLYILTDLMNITNASGWKYIGTASSPGGGMSGVGNIDGGRADEVYVPGQVINGGDENGAIIRGETDEE